MSENNWNMIGNQLRSAVEESLNTGNFERLGSVLSDTVNSAVSEVKDQVRQTKENRAGEAGGQGGRSGFAGGNTGAGGAFSPIPPAPSKVKMNKVGNVSGVLYMVFGGIGTGVMGLALLIQMFVGIFTGFGAVFGNMAWIVVFIALFILLIRHGSALCNRLSRAKRYAELCGNRHYCNIRELAMQVNRTESEVLKDVKKMLKKGIFPEGHLDQEETCLMLDHFIWQQYLAVQKERKAREMEEKVARMQKRQSGQPVSGEEQARAAQAAEARAAQEAAAQNPELDAMVREGQECIRRLRNMNDNIKGEHISARLFQLENLLKEIFERVKEHPEQMPQMRKFMNYYLPTTLKLVEAYEEFDSVSVPGEDILQAKAEIEKTLDTINHAFAELLNRLFRDSVFDATTDAQVLQTMLAKEGLTKSPIFEEVRR